MQESSPSLHRVTRASRSPVVPEGMLDTIAAEPLRANLVPAPLEQDVLVLNRSSRTLCGLLGEVPLQGRVFRAAERLMRQLGEYVRHDQVVTALWPNPDETAEHAGDCLRAAMAQLRAAVARVAGGAAGVRTERRVGYALAVVRR